LHYLCDSVMVIRSTNFNLDNVALGLESAQYMYRDTSALTDLTVTRMSLLHTHKYGDFVTRYFLTKMYS